MILSTKYPLLFTVLGRELTKSLEEHLIEIEKVGRDEHLQECDIWHWCARLNECVRPDAFNDIEFGLQNISSVVSEQECVNHFKGLSKAEHSIYSFIQEVTVGSRLATSDTLLAACRFEDDFFMNR